jgi:signal transduction histidine kinase
VKYGPRGQTVSVRVRAAGDEVQIEVADEGPGIPAADRESIWLPYQRGRSARHTAGSGIGLAIVRDIVQQHGGRASIGEAPGGRGALFVVALPIAAGQTDMAAKKATQPVAQPVAG